MNIVHVRLESIVWAFVVLMSHSLRSPGPAVKSLSEQQRHEQEAQRWKGGHTEGSDLTYPNGYLLFPRYLFSSRAILKAQIFLAPIFLKVEVATASSSHQKSLAF